MAIEIERKFLVKGEIWAKIQKPEGRVLKQGYLLSSREKTIRIRLDGDHAFLTVKGEGTHFSRAEFEFEIPLKDATEMLETLAGHCIEKTRFEVEVAGKIWEIDEFHGKNHGLIMAEIELEAESESFELPEWAGKEVSQDHRFFNAWLSEHPFREWAHEI